MKAGFAVRKLNNAFHVTNNGYFMHIHGPAWSQSAPGSQKKLCFVARDQELLAEILGELAERPDCVYVKYSLYNRDGMYLGRCFMRDDHEVGVLWAKYKEHPLLFCSVQDDDFTAPFRPSE